METKFDDLLSVMARVEHKPAVGAHLKVAKLPHPFAAPPLITDQPFEAEVILLKASAAVGKSTLARYISSACSAPLLDLSVVPVSTGTLKALVLDLKGDEPINNFHAGKVPIIVDALDEGRLLSGETGFESFLESAGKFLLENREVRNRPKLVLLGRHDSAEEAATWFNIAAEGVTVQSVNVDYFGEFEARQLIDSYALQSAPADSQYRKHPEPARELVDAYFKAIGAAVGAPNGELWRDTQGKSFAGYAPILAALGSLLARIDNFKEVANRLDSQGRQEAWGVIETVLDEILKREQGKVCEKLSTQVTGLLPEETYDPHEQLDFLTSLIHGEPIGSSSRVKLPSGDQVKYHTMVKQYIGEHPFVRQGRPINSVLGSLVLAHAITNDILKNKSRELLSDYSQQPFIWRSFRNQVQNLDNILIDGDVFGHVLNSYWNDPNSAGVVRVRGNDDGSASITIPTEIGQPLVVAVTLPLRFYSQMRACDAQLDDTVILEGRRAKSAGASFYIHGRSTVIIDTLDVQADSVTIDGSLWIQAEEVGVLPQLTLYPRQDAEVGWGGKLAENYPWSSIPSTRTPPSGSGEIDVLTALLDQCAARLPDLVLVVLDNFTFSEGENRWASRDFTSEFPQLIELLIKHDLASAESFGTYAQNKYRIHLNTTWAALREAIDSPSSDQRVNNLIREARSLFSFN